VGVKTLLTYHLLVNITSGIIETLITFAMPPKQKYEMEDSDDETPASKKGRSALNSIGLEPK